MSTLPTGVQESQLKTLTEAPLSTALDGGVVVVTPSYRSIRYLKFRHGWLPYNSTQTNRSVFSKITTTQTAINEDFYEAAVVPPYYDPLPDGYTTSDAVTGAMVSTHTTGRFDPLGYAEFPTTWNASSDTSFNGANADGWAFSCTLADPEYGQDSLDHVMSNLSTSYASWGQYKTFQFNEWIQNAGSLPSRKFVTQSPYVNYSYDDGGYGKQDPFNEPDSTSFSGYDGAIDSGFTASGSDGESAWVVMLGYVFVVHSQFRTNNHYCLISGRQNEPFGAKSEPWALIEESDGDYFATTARDIPLPTNTTIDEDEMAAGIYGRSVFVYFGTWEQFQIDHAGEVFE